MADVRKVVKEVKEERETGISGGGAAAVRVLAKATSSALFDCFLCKQLL